MKYSTNIYADYHEDIHDMSHQKVVDYINRLAAENNRQQATILSHHSDYQKLVLQLTQVKEVTETLSKGLEYAQKEIRLLKETAALKDFASQGSKATKAFPEISSIYQLVRCYYEAKGFQGNEEDIIQGCQLVIDFLKDNGCEERYYRESIKQKMIDNIQTSIVWADPQICIKPYNPALFLVLFESHKNHLDLLSFPLRKPFIRDVLVRISSAKNSVHIEVGIVKSSEDTNTISKTKMKLQSSLLCLKWLDKVITDLDVNYNLIGNIYINEHRPSPYNFREEYEDELFTFKTMYIKRN